MNRQIMLLDMDSFFASVEEAQRPWLKGKSIIVVGGPDKRCAVNAASYAAKEKGIHGGMSLEQARRICPDGIYIQADLNKYVYVSGRIIEILENFSPRVEPSSIDEAYLDITGESRIFGSPFDIARKIKGKIADELDLVASVGIAPNKTWAKIACETGKPDGLVVIDEQGIGVLAEKLSVDKMPGVGKSTCEILTKLGIITIQDLARYSKQVLINLFGKNGVCLHDLANGIDNSPVVSWQDLPLPKSVGHEYTMPMDIDNLDELLGILGWLTETVTTRMRSMNAHARTVQLKIRFSNYRTIIRRITVGEFASEIEAYGYLRKLLLDYLPGGFSVRQIGVIFTGLEYSKSYRPKIPGIVSNIEQIRANEAVDQIKRRWGSDCIRWGRSAKWLLSKDNALLSCSNPLE